MRKSFTRLFGLFMLLSMFSFSVVGVATAQTLSPADGSTVVKPQSDGSIALTIKLAKAVEAHSDGTGVVALSHWNGSNWPEVQTIQIKGADNGTGGNTVSISDDGKTIDISFENGKSAPIPYEFKAGEQFLVTVSTDAFQGAGDFDLSSNLNAPGGVVADHDWNFTIGDFQAPYAVAYYPSDDTTGIGVNTVGFTNAEGNTGLNPDGTVRTTGNVNDVLSILFNENIKIASKYTAAGATEKAYVTVYTKAGDIVEIIDITDNSTAAFGQNPIPGGVDYDPQATISIVGKELFVTLGQNSTGKRFEELTEYFVRITEDAIVDMSTSANAYKGIKDNTTWNFKTDHEQAIKVSLKTPTAGATKVKNTEDIVVKLEKGHKDAPALALFKNVNSQNAYKVGEDMSSVVSLSSTVAGAVVPADYTVKMTADNTVTIALKSGKTWSHLAEYTVNVATTKFYDIFDNTNAAAAFKFTTDDYQKPVISALTVNPNTAEKKTDLLVTPTVTIDATDRTKETSFNKLTAYYYAQLTSNTTAPNVAAIMAGKSKQSKADGTFDVMKLTTAGDGSALLADTDYTVYVVVEDASAQKNVSTISNKNAITYDNAPATYKVTAQADKGDDTVDPTVATDNLSGIDKYSAIVLTFDDEIYNDAAGTAFDASQISVMYKVPVSSTYPTGYKAVPTTASTSITGTATSAAKTVVTLVPSTADAVWAEAYWTSEKEYFVFVEDKKIFDENGNKASKDSEATMFSIEDYEGPSVAFVPVDQSGVGEPTKVKVSEIEAGMTVTFSETPYTISADTKDTIMLDNTVNSLQYIKNHITLRVDSNGDNDVDPTDDPIADVTVTLDGLTATVVVPDTYKWLSETQYGIFVQSTVVDEHGYVLNNYEDTRLATTGTPIAGALPSTSFEVEDLITPVLTFGQDDDAAVGSEVISLVDLKESEYIYVQFNESVWTSPNVELDLDDANQVRSYVSLTLDGKMVEFEVATNTTATIAPNDESAIWIKPLDDPKTPANDSIFIKDKEYVVRVDGLMDNNQNAVDTIVTYITEKAAFEWKSGSPVNGTALAYAETEGDIVLTFSHDVASQNNSFRLVLTPSTGTAVTIPLNTSTVKYVGKTVVVEYAGLDSDETYTVTLDGAGVGAFRENAGSRINLTPVSFTFTTKDTQGPYLDLQNATSDVKPANGTGIPTGTTGVPVDTKLTFDIAEKVKIGEGFVIVRKLENNGAFSVFTLDIADATVTNPTATSTKIVLDLPGSLEYETVYAVEVGENCFQDLSAQNNAYQFISDVQGSYIDGPVALITPVSNAQHWSFKTAAYVAPKADYDLSKLNPKQEETGVVANQGLEFTFSNPTQLKAAASVGQLQRLIIHEFDRDYATLAATEPLYMALPSVATPWVPSDLTAVEAIHLNTAALTWTNDNKTLSVAHAYQFKADKFYVIEIDANVFEEIAAPHATIPVLNSTITALPVATDVTAFDGTGWYFSTEDWTVPEVVSASLSTNGCDKVVVGEDIQVTFSEAIKEVNPGDLNTLFTAGFDYTATLSDDKKIVTIKPSTTGTVMQQFQEYKLTLNANNVASVDGYNVENEDSIDVIVFTTEDKTAPKDPTVELNKRDGSSITLDVTTATGNGDSKFDVYVLAVETGADKPTAVQVKAGVYQEMKVEKKAFTISGLKEFTAYDIYVDVYDKACTPNRNEGAARKVYTLDVTAPTIVSVTPADDAECAQFNASNEMELVITASEDVVANSEDATYGSQEVVVRRVSDNVAVFSSAFSAPAQPAVPLATPINLVATGKEIKVTIPADTLDDATEYYVEIAYGLFQDKKNSTITDEYTTAGVLKSDATKRVSDLVVDTLVAHWYGATEYAWNFTTDDTTNPDVVKTAPHFKNPITGVGDVKVASTTDKLTIEFTEEVQIGAGAISIYRRGMAVPQEIINPAGLTAGKTIEIPLAHTLASNTEYAVVIPAGVFKDQSCRENEFDGFKLPTNFDAKNVTVPGIDGGYEADTWVFETADEIAPTGNFMYPDFAGTYIHDNDPIKGEKGVMIHNATAAPAASSVIAVLPFAEDIYTNAAAASADELLSTTTKLDKYFTLTVAGLDAFHNVDASETRTTPSLNVTYNDVTNDFVIALKDGSSSKTYTESLTQYTIEFNASSLFDQFGNALKSTSATFSTDDWNSPVAMYTPAFEDYSKTGTIDKDVALDVHPTISWNKYIVYNDYPHENYPPMDANRDGKIDDGVKVENFIEFLQFDTEAKVKAYLGNDFKAPSNYVVPTAASLTAAGATKVAFTVKYAEGGQGKEYDMNNTTTGSGQLFELIPTNKLAEDKYYLVRWIADNNPNLPAGDDSYWMRDQVRYDQLHEGNVVVPGVNGSNYTVFETENTSAPKLIEADVKGAANPAVKVPFGYTASTSVNPNTTVTIEFDRDVTIGTGNIYFRYGNGQVFEVLDVTSANVKAVGTSKKIFELDPTANFTENSDFYVEMEEGTFLAAHSNKTPFVGTIGITGTDDNRWIYFTTSGSSAPYIVNSYPTDDQVDVEVFTELRFKFSESITAVNGKNMVIYRGLPAKLNGGVDGQAIEIIEVAAALANGRAQLLDSDRNHGNVNDSLIITVNNNLYEYFTSQASYYVRFDEGTFVDPTNAADKYAGQPGAQNVDYWSETDGVFNFTITNDQAPTYTTLAPEADKKNVAQDITEFTMTMDIDVLAGEGVIGLYEYYFNEGTGEDFKLVEEYDVADADAVVVDGKTVTIKPTVKLRDNMYYYILVEASAITNTASTLDWMVGKTNDVAGDKRLGNGTKEYGIQNPFEWRFSTVVDTDVPVLAGADSLTFATTVNNATVTMSFNEGVYIHDIKDVVAITADNADTVKAATGVVEGNVLKVNFNDLLEDNTDYYLNVSADAVSDTATMSTGYAAGEYLADPAAPINYFAGFDANDKLTFTTGNFIIPEPTLLTPTVNAQDSVLAYFGEYLVVAYANEDSIELDTEAPGTITIKTDGVDDVVLSDFEVTDANKVKAALGEFSFADYTTYTVEVSEGLVLDNDVEPALSLYGEFTFSTGDVNRPEVTITSDPEFTMVDAPNAFELTFTLSETATGSITVGTETKALTADMAYAFDVTGNDGDTIKYVLDLSDAAGNKNADKGYFVIGDNTAPVIAQAYPADGQEISIAGSDSDSPITIVLEFNEALVAGEGQVVVAGVDTTITIAASEFEADTLDASTFTYAMSNVLDLGEYTISVVDSAFVDAKEDAATNIAVADTTWSFKVVDGLFDCFTGITGTDADDDTLIDVDTLGTAQIFVEFCEEITLSTADGMKLFVYDITEGVDGEPIYEVLPANINVDGKMMDFIGKNLEESKQYLISFTKGLVSDKVGNEFENADELQNFTFRTDDMSAPTVTLLSDAEVNVIDGSFTISVDELSDVVLMSADDSIAVQAGVEGEFTFAVQDITPGIYTICAYDAAGNKGVCDATVTINDVETLSIAAIQGNAETSPYEGKTVATKGFVTAVYDGYFTIQDADGAWNGIQVKGDANQYTTVQLYGPVSEEDGVTTITALYTKVVSDIDAPVAAEVTAEDYATEKFESVLVKTVNGRVAAAGTAVDLAGISISDAIFSYEFNVGSWYNVTGVVIEGKVTPRNNGDVDFRNDNTEIEMVSIYPNPFSNVINISEVAGIERVVITNLAGQIVKDVMNPTSEITTNELRSGVYLISLMNNEGIAKTERIIKK